MLSCTIPGKYISWGSEIMSNVKIVDGAKLLVMLGLAAVCREALRLIEQGGVRVNDVFIRSRFVAASSGDRVRVGRTLEAVIAPGHIDACLGEA